MQIITRAYEGHAIAYQDDGWFNATHAAAKYGKRPNDWLALTGTQEYIAALHRHLPNVKRFHLARKGGDTSGAGNAQGTWLHPKLAVYFARWLNVDFAIWCDAQIDELLIDKTDWRKLRAGAASTNKVVNAMLHEVRAAVGKATQAHHYMTESKLVNWAHSGEFSGIDRDGLDALQLELLSFLELKNATLIGRDVPYADRKPLLKQYAMDWRVSHPLIALQRAVSTTTHTGAA